MTLRAVAGPNARLDRAMLSRIAGSFSLTTLPAVMLYALGRDYRIGYDNLGQDGIRIRFEIGPAADETESGDSQA